MPKKNKKKREKKRGSKRGSKRRRRRQISEDGPVFLDPYDRDPRAYAYANDVVQAALRLMEGKVESIEDQDEL